MRSSGILALGFFLALGALARTCRATELYVGVGASFAEDPEEGISEAFDAAFKKSGASVGRFVFVFENYTSKRGGNALIPLIFEKARGLPVYGACMGKGDYTPQSPAKGYPKKRGISVMVAGGDFRLQAEMVTTGPVKYFNNRDKKTNPEKFKREYQTFIDNRQKPGAELGRKLKFGPDQNLLIVVGQLHNPEITFFAKGLKESIPEGTPAIGAATMGGHVYMGEKPHRSATIGLLIGGKFKITEASCGPFWFGKNLPENYAKILREAVIEGNPEPDLVLGLLCASWKRGPVEEQHKAFVETLGKDVPFLGTYSGGEMFNDKKKGLIGGGAFGVIVAVKGLK